MTQILIVSEASVVAHANTEQLGLPMLAVAVGSCYLLLFMKRFANIVRVFMTVSDLNLLLSIILRSRSLSWSKSSSEESYFGS